MCQIQDGVFYDLRPPAIVISKISPQVRKIFHRVQCEYQVPGKPNEYVVKGIPEGGEQEESFVLIFTQKGEVRAFRSESQGPKIIKLSR